MVGGRDAPALCDDARDGTALGLTTTTMTSFSKVRRWFGLGRLHSATGVVPVGAFFVLHLWTNARAMQGRAAYDHLVRRLQATPGLALLEVLGILAPLAFHAGYGVLMALGVVPSPSPPRHAKSWSRSVQRLTGAATLGFVCFHLWSLRAQVALGRMRPPDFFSTLCDSLSSTTSLGIPLAASAYLFGLASTAYHFANGFETFCLRFELVTEERSAKVLSAACTLLGMTLFLAGARTVVYFATGAGFPGPGSFSR
jgi:succinate dehydrogenase/fumarate reductase cytochrome b subunit (b558 family)